MKKLIFVVLATASLTGCVGMITNTVTGQRYETLNDRMNSYVNDPEERLISRWGPPSRSYTLANGSKIISYEDEWDSCIPKFMIQNGKVTKWGHTGCDQGFTNEKLPKETPIPQPTL